MSTVLVVFIPNLEDRFFIHKKPCWLSDKVVILRPTVRGVCSFPKRIFHPLPGKPSGTLHVTSDRLIFIRAIDVWKEVKPLLTPLGLPTAAERESSLNRLMAIG